MNLQRTTSLGGMVLIAAAIVTLVVVGLSIAGSSDKSPFERKEVAEFLTDTHDKEGTLAAAVAVSIFNDGVILPLLAATLYVLFRDRNPFLATASALGVLLGGAAALVSDGGNILLLGVAGDYVKGGAGDIPAGDPATLEVGRFIGATSFAFFNVAFTGYGLALVSIGALLLGPEGRINPPKWLGWAAILGGLSAWLAWSVVVVDAGFVFFPINLVITTIFSLGLGFWLTRHGDLEPAPMNA